MEKERLVIKNFGPIKSVDLELGKMTIIIGDQATGKSTIAKVLAVCRYFSAIVDFMRDFEQLNDFHNHQLFQDTLARWGMSKMLTNSTSIKYTCNLYSFEANGKLTPRKSIFASSNQESEILDLKVETKIKSLNSDFSNLISQMIELRNDELTESASSSKSREINKLLNRISWYPNENFFRLNVKKVMDNPLYISTERGIDSSDFDRHDYIGDTFIFDHLRKTKRREHVFIEEKHLDALSIEYKSIQGKGYVKSKDDSDFHLLHLAASGYRTAIPIVLNTIYYSEIEKRAKTFIVEEPEISLFPTTQKKLMEFFVENVNNHGQSFVIPTHSPFLLSSVNDLLLAYKRGQQNEDKVTKIIKKESWLNPDDLSVYQLKNGQSFDIFDKESALIADNIIDDVSDEMNDEFDSLLEI